jgi:hypothetical protein
MQKLTYTGHDVKKHHWWTHHLVLLLACGLACGLAYGLIHSYWPTRSELEQSAAAKKHTNNFAVSGVFFVWHGMAIQKPSCAIGGSPDIQAQANDAGPNGAGSKKLNVEFLSPDQYSPWTVNNLGFDKYEKLTVTIGCSFK